MENQNQQTETPNMNSMNNPLLTEQELKTLRIAFLGLIKTRAELIGLYDVDFYLAKLRKKGYKVNQIIMMLEMAESLKTYNKPLGLGDIISNYEENRTQLSEAEKNVLN